MGENGGMSEGLKWTIGAALLGGSNVASNGAQFLAGDQERDDKVEIVMLSDVLGEQLKLCYEQLNECYAKCQ